MTSSPRIDYTHTESFHEVLVDQLRRTPWLLLSLAVHAVLLVILSQFSTYKPTPIEAIPFTVAADDGFKEPPVELPPDEQPDEIDKPEDVTEPDPVKDDVPISDHTETDNDAPTDEAKGEEDNESLKPFTGETGLATIGLGATGSGGPFGGRRGGNEDLRGDSGRGTRKHVHRGLLWLAEHQSQDGSWDSDGFPALGDPGRGPLCDGPGGAMYDVGNTGLALLAFLGAGYTHREGEFKDVVRKGLKWLRSSQDPEGCFGGRSAPQFVYGHAIAALAMAEAYGMTRSGLWRQSAQRGIDFVMQCQNPYKAWRYGMRTGENDSSVTGWMVMALKSAQMAGLDVNETSMRWARDYIVGLTDEDTGRTGYTKRGERPVRADGRLEQYPADESESLTAVGMLVRMFAGEDPRESAAIKAGAELLRKRLPSWEPAQGKVDMYYWYYGTLSMFQVGGAAWSAWNHRMKGAIIQTQRGDGNFAGSWDPVGPWGEDGGRVYSTAMMTLCLEVYYRYRRVFGTR